MGSCSGKRTWAYEYVCMYVLWKLRQQPQFYPLGPSILYFEADSLTALEITNWARLTGQWAQDCTCLWLPSAGIPSKLPPCLSFLHGSQGLNSVSHAYMQALYWLGHFSSSLLLSLTPISHLHLQSGPMGIQFMTPGCTWVLTALCGSWVVFNFSFFWSVFSNFDKINRHGFCNKGERRRFN